MKICSKSIDGVFVGGLKGKKIRFLGIGGVGVNALAKYALKEGAIVTGSDRKFNSLCAQIVALGGNVFEGEDENYEENWREAMEQADDDERPEVTFFCALSAAALTEGEERERLILGYASNLDAQLKTQRRCRICGCTDENACYGGCSWVEIDLCSKCMGGWQDE